MVAAPASSSEAQCAKCLTVVASRLACSPHSPPGSACGERVDLEVLLSLHTRVEASSHTLSPRPRLKKRFAFAGLVGGVSAWVLLTATIWQRLWAFSASLPAPLPNKSVLVSMFEHYPSSPAGWVYLLATAALLPAVAEELLFRGFVLSALKPHLGRVDAVILAGALFGMFHLNLPQFFATTGITHSGTTMARKTPIPQLPIQLVVPAIIGFVIFAFMIRPGWERTRYDYWNKANR
eukprot:SM000007S20945  [mRNA]  locus=s7:1176222:1178660:+ [translate_table: standard]